MNYKETWRVRKKHILLWGIFILIAVAALVYNTHSTTSLGGTICFAVCSIIGMLWFLPPLTLVSAQYGSVVSFFARGFHNWINGIFGGSSDYSDRDTPYNLNNPMDSFCFGLGIFLLVGKVMARMFFFSIYCFVYIFCYLFIAIPFPLVTFIYFLKSRDEIKPLYVVIPIVIYVVLLVFLGIMFNSWEKSNEEKRRVAAEKMRAEEEANGRIYVEDLGKYEGVYFVVTADGTSDVRTGAGEDYDVIQTVDTGSTLVGTSLADVNGEDLWYEIYLDEAKTKKGWIEADSVRQEKQEKFDIQLYAIGTIYISDSPHGKPIVSLKNGDKVQGTGNILYYGENRLMWYEVYTDDEMTEKAWLFDYRVNSKIFVK